MPQEDFKISIEGLSEVQKLLSSLPDDVNERLVKDLNKKAGGIVAKELRQATPDSTTSTKKAKHKLSNKVVVKPSKTKTGVYIGFSKAGFPAIFLERGTSVRATTGKGKYKEGANRGSISKKPFIESAYEKAVPKAIDFLEKNYLKILNQSIKKYLKRLK